MIDKISRFELFMRITLLIIFFIFFMFPIYWMVVTSLKNTVDILEEQQSTLTRTTLSL